MSDAETPYQDLESEPGESEQIYIEPNPNDPELLKLRREAGDPTAPVEDPQ